MAQRRSEDHFLGEKLFIKAGLSFLAKNKQVVSSSSLGQHFLANHPWTGRPEGHEWSPQHGSAEEQSGGSRESLWVREGPGRPVRRAGRRAWESRASVSR